MPMFGKWNPFLPKRCITTSEPACLLPFPPFFILKQIRTNHLLRVIHESIGIQKLEKLKEALCVTF